MDAKTETALQLDLSEQAFIARIFENNRDLIDVKKPKTALPNLTRILKAAIRLSARSGFEAMSMRDLAQEAEISMGGLYAYVPHKKALLSMILREVTDTGVFLMNNVPAAYKTDPRTELRWMIDAHLRMTEAMQPWFAFLYLEAKSFPVEERRGALKAEETTTAQFADVIRRGTEAGVFAAGDPDLQASLIKPLLQEWYVKRAKYRRRDCDVDTYIAAVIAMIENGLAPQPPECD